MVAASTRRALSERAAPRGGNWHGRRGRCSGGGRRSRIGRCGLRGSRRQAEVVEALAPIQLEAAQAAEEQARARYDSGLGNIADVADTKDDPRDGTMSAAVEAFVLDSTRAANVYLNFAYYGKPPWTRFQKRNVVVHVATARPDLRRKAEAALATLG